VKSATMAIGCGATCAKIILIIYDILFLLTGIALIACGGVLLVNGTVANLVHLTFNGTNSALLRNSAILLISIGCVIILMSVVGLVGAIMENKILLGIYIGFLVLVFCGEIAGGVLAIVFKDQIVDGMNTILSNSLSQTLIPHTSSSYYQTNANSTDPCFTSADGYVWDFVQFTFTCCGVSTGSSGYVFSSNYTFQTMCPLLNVTTYPISCYPPKSVSFTWSMFYSASTSQGDNQNTLQNNFDFTQPPYSGGCEDAVTYWIERYAPILIGIGIGFAMLELFGIIFAVCLCRNVGHDID